jgi:hypothetical protein
MTKPPKENPPCCLCGGVCERIGNNPAPLSMQKGDRCCDACNEVVVGARIDMKGFVAEYERVEQAVLRMPKRAVMAAICAAHGPDLLAMRKAEFEKFQAFIEAEKEKL